MNKYIKNFLVVFAFVGMTFVTVYAGREWGFSEGYKHGHNVGIQDGRSQVPSNQWQVDSLTTRNNYLEQQNQGLVDQYNDLVNKANAALARPVYQPTSISCTTNSLGSYTYTNCF